MTIVKCLYCGREFNNATEPYIKPKANRYAHESCCTDDNPDWIKDKIRMYAKEQLGALYNPAKVNAQIKEYTTKLYITPLDIYQTLVYWYEVQGAAPEKSFGGIGIVPNILTEAKQYFENKQDTLKRISIYNMKDYIDKDVETVQIKWKPPSRPKNYKIIDLE